MFNLNAEIEVLGAIIIENNALCEIIDFITIEDFCDNRHKVLYKAMVALYTAESPIDVITLSEKIGLQLGQVISISYLNEIISSSCTAANIKTHAEIIHEKAKLRKLDQLFNEALRNLRTEEIESGRIINDLTEKFLALQGNTKKEEGKLAPYLTQFLHKLKQRSELGGGIEGIKTGYATLDTVTGGFNSGDYIILAARPSMGKSAFSINLALNASLKAKAKVAYFNLETSVEQSIHRGISIYSSILMDSLKNAKLKQDEWTTLQSGITALNTENLKIFENTISLSSLKAQCKRLKLQGGLDVVFIDYLQLVKGEDRVENRNADISNISRTLKLMARELGITVVALSQLSRAPEVRVDHRPMLSDLRDSGSIEQDADMVLLLYRDIYYNSESDTPNALECIVAKNRNGEVGTIKFTWKGKYQQVL